MKLPIDFHPDVYPEIDQADRWYEAKQPGLGRDFMEAVEAVLAEIAANPRRFAIERMDVRAAPVDRFPYIVYYRVLPRRIRVTAVVHTSRDPAVWQGRV